jgi:hypothetical protein
VLSILAYGCVFAEDTVTVRRIDPNSAEARYLQRLVDDQSKDTASVRPRRVRVVRQARAKKAVRYELHSLLPWAPNAPGD